MITLVQWRDSLGHSCKSTTNYDTPTTMLHIWNGLKFLLTVVQLTCTTTDLYNSGSEVMVLVCTSFFPFQTKHYRLLSKSSTFATSIHRTFFTREWQDRKNEDNFMVSIELGHLQWKSHCFLKEKIRLNSLFAPTFWKHNQ